MSILLLLVGGGAAIPTDMTATTPTGSSGILVLPGSSYGAVAYIRAASTVASCLVAIKWYDSGGTIISTSSSSTATDSASAWTQLKVTATAPATAKYAAVAVTAQSGFAGDVHYVDDIGLYRLSAPSPY